MSLHFRNTSLLKLAFDSLDRVGRIIHLALLNTRSLAAKLAGTVNSLRASGFSARKRYFVVENIESSCDVTIRSEQCVLFVNISSCKWQAGKNVTIGVHGHDVTDVDDRRIKLIQIDTRSFIAVCIRDADETFMAVTETRPRHWKIPPRRDETRRDVGYVSRPSRDRDVETETTSLVGKMQGPKGREQGRALQRE